MVEKQCEFYLVQGRLDLSILDDEINEEEAVQVQVHVQPIDREERMLKPYKDQGIEMILHEMGELFCGGA